MAHGKTNRNPAKDVNLRMILPKTIKKHYASIKDPDLLAHLLKTIDEYHGTIQVKTDLQLFPLVMVRPTELTSAEWSEFDLDKSIWKILNNLKQYTGNGKYLFPSVRTRSRPISNDTVRSALRVMGFDNNTITAHGFRSIASTFLNTLGFRSDVIEAQLAHKDKNEIRSAYNHADYMEERKVMLQEWANYLDNLKAGADVIPIKHEA